MCTVIILRRPGHAWPLICAANRDERIDRPWDPPAAHWVEHPGVLGGRDRLASGTWMALGPGGVLATVLNRPGSLGPAEGKRSRGELPLRAAASLSAMQAAQSLATLDAAEWRPFNLVLVDRHDGFFLRGRGEGRPDVLRLDDGVTMVTAHDPNDLDSPRIRRHLPLFVQAPPPDPDAGDWQGWERMLTDAAFGSVGIAEALRVPPVRGFGTVCSSLLALAADGRRRWRFCDTAAARDAFRDVLPE